VRLLYVGIEPGLCGWALVRVVLPLPLSWGCSSLCMVPVVMVWDRGVVHVGPGIQSLCAAVCMVQLCGIAATVVVWFLHPTWVAASMDVRGTCPPGLPDMLYPTLRGWWRGVNRVHSSLAVQPVQHSLCCRCEPWTEGFSTNTTCVPAAYCGGGFFGSLRAFPISPQHNVPLLAVVYRWAPVAA